MEELKLLGKDWLWLCLVCKITVVIRDVLYLTLTQSMMVKNIQTNFTEQMFGVEAGNCGIVTRKLSSAVLRVTVFLSHWPQDCPCQPGTQLLHSADITDWRGERWGGGNTSPGPFFVPLLLSFTSQLQLFKYLNNFYTGLEQSFSSFSVCLIINHQHHHASLSFSLLFIIRINLI